MNSFISWIGGKKLLRKEIIKRFPDSMKKYIEVFGGAGWVLFGKEQFANQLEVFNDIDGDLINLYCCVKYHCEELQKELQLILNSRELFFDAKEQQKIRGLTDIQRAARFFYLIRFSFGSNRDSYGLVKKTVIKPITYLSEVSKRLESVVIENKDFRNLLLTYDSKETLFYLDPPYVGTEKYYSNKFTKEDHVLLKETLDNIKGKFVLSYNDCAYIRELYGKYNIDSVSRTNNLKGDASKFKEVIITNFK